jgi:hypothetical protein
MVLHLLDQYGEDKKNFPYHIVCDNLFTLALLMNELKNRGYNCTGTIRPNRLDKTCPLTRSEYIAKHKSRDYMETVTTNMDRNQFLVTRWKDNAVVTSNGQQPVGTTTRWSRVEKSELRFLFLVA